MQAKALSGGFADPPREAARAFRACLQVMARPGRIFTVEGAAPPAPLSPAAGAVALVLCDGETPLFLAPGHNAPALRDWLAFHCGAPLVAERARAAFGIGTWAALDPGHGDWPLGSDENPHLSATLIVEVDRLAQTGARLTGPGIETEARLSLPETGFFAANRAHFPRGLDLFLCCGDRLAAVPRSTRVEAG
ncbi:MAG: phosphonate C-P lyase system protein PhnH [Alphaproteobacteria bacterium HGW-Alphaproteobacteria-2]|nr:MAG: phosphonate C-P lyase system protein PhnH [Alphaproteobacteria bacterium HGW-Alphaproteobacteria-2]